MKTATPPSRSRISRQSVPSYRVSPDQKRYRESYISDDLDTDPQGCCCSEGSPRLSRQSTCSSGIEVDARHHGNVSMEMASVGTAVSAEGDSGGGQRRRAEKCFSSAASHGSSHTSGVDVGGVNAPAQDDEDDEDSGDEVVEFDSEEVLKDGESCVSGGVALEGGLTGGTSCG